MEVGEARRVLGVAPGDGDDQVRAAFRRLVRRHHPDIDGGRRPDAGATTARIVDAYHTLRRVMAGPAGEPAGASGAGRPAPVSRSAWAEGDTVVVAAPAGETWAALLEAGHGLGEVAYVDRSAALLEIVVTFIDHPVCSVVLTLQGVADGTTHAFCTVEALGGDEPPPVHLVAALVADRVAGLVP